MAPYLQILCLNFKIEGDISLARIYVDNDKTLKDLSDINKIKYNEANQNPPQVAIDLLVKFYKDGQFMLVIEQTRVLIKQYTETFMFMIKTKFIKD